MVLMIALGAVGLFLIGVGAWVYRENDTFAALLSAAGGVALVAAAIFVVSDSIRRPYQHR